MTVDVLVVGSLHRDVVVTAPRLPRLDETLPGESFRLVCGGKGGNQATAAARMGARVAMVGRVGADGFGAELLAGLEAGGVDRALVAVDPAAPAGMSVAIVDQAGDYGAVIVSGANLLIPPGEAAAAVRRLSPRVLVLQNEVPAAVNRAAAEAGSARGVPVIWNAAPAREADPALVAAASILVVNRVEAAAMAGHSVETVDEALAVAKALAGSARDAVVTLGADGLAYADRDGTGGHLAAVPVPVVSTHGAGDMFVGALAARLAGGAALVAALRFAAAAATLQVGADEAARARLDAEAVRAFLGVRG
jgi:ribokinase